VYGVAGGCSVDPVEDDRQPRSAGPDGWRQGVVSAIGEAEQRGRSAATAIARFEPPGEGRRACPLCGAPERRPALVKHGWPVVRCASCALVYVDAQPDRNALERVYDEGYYTGEAYVDYVGERDERIASARTQAGRLARQHPGGRLLDVGCAAGFFLEAAGEHYEVTGVELSEWAARHARETFGHHVVTGDLFDGAFPNRHFDVVTMWDVIEHLADPVAALTEVARVIRPGGLLALSTGNVEGPLARHDLNGWGLMGPPWHLFYFSPKTIEHLLNATGFEVNRIYLDGRLATAGPLAHPKVQWVAAKVGVGDIMYVYARRADRPRHHGWLTRLPHPVQASARRLAPRIRGRARTPGSPTQTKSA
jgi:SAM-dependent methyltransferase